jgi:hypothetical protein
MKPEDWDTFIGVFSVVGIVVLCILLIAGVL